MKILLVGPQGSGKSTQGKILSKNLHIPVISTGEIFRNLSASSDPKSAQIRQILISGKLVNDKLTSEVVKERVLASDCANGFIMDGYPRNSEQIKLFDPNFDKVIYFKLSDEQATNRLLKRGREDDTLESVAQRLKIYHQQTDPILGYFKNLGILFEVDGQKSIEEVSEQVKKVING